MSLDNVKNIVLVLSGKGGVGKSSVTTQFALSLSLAGHSVGILDVDLTGPSIPRLFGLENAKITQAPGGWLPVRVHASQILPLVPSKSQNEEEANGLSSSDGDNIGMTSTEGSNAIGTNGHDPSTPAPGSPIGSLHLMSLGFLLPSRSSAVVWRGPKKTAMVRQFLTDVLWPPNLDYLLIDTPPGTSDEHISLAETLLKVASSGPNGSLNGGKRQPHLAGALIVTTPQAVATSDVRKELNFCVKVGIEVLGVVENMSGYICECCGESANLFGQGGGLVMSQDFNVRFLGGIPIDRQWGVLVEEGRRPAYGGGVRSGEDEDDESDEEYGGDEESLSGADAARESSDEDLLVDRYRSCSLAATFERIAREVIDMIESAK